jgi:hypothetical protein
VDRVRVEQRCEIESIADGQPLRVPPRQLAQAFSEALALAHRQLPVPQHHHHPVRRGTRRERLDPIEPEPDRAPLGIRDDDQRGRHHSAARGRGPKTRCTPA